MRVACYPYSGRHTLPGVHSMPCPEVTVGFRQELLATGMPVAFVPRRGLLDQARGWLSTWRRDTRLSLFRARCCSYQHVFVPRDDFIYAMCQVYLGEEELSSKKLAH